MSDFLTAVSTVPLRPKPSTEKGLIQDISAEKPKSHGPHISPTSAEQVLEILRSSPDQDAINDLLYFLNQDSQKTAGFEIKVPSPSAAKVINELINTTIPDFWDSSDEFNHAVLDCLRSVAGIGAVLARLKFLSSQYESGQRGAKASEAARPLLDLLSILTQLLTPDDLAQCVFTDTIRLVDNQTRRALLWKEFLTSVGSGKIVAAVAEAEDRTKTARDLGSSSWLSDGSKYSAWLGRNVCAMMRETAKDVTTWKATAQFCGKGFGIGYAARMVEEIHVHSTVSSPESMSLVQILLQHLQNHEQRQFLEFTIKFAAKSCPSLQESPDYDATLSDTQPPIAAAAALIAGLLDQNNVMKDHLATWLSDPTVNSSESFGLRRAAVCAFVHASEGAGSMIEDPAQDLMEKVMKTFGENLFIKHAPILQQEACAQVLLMTAGKIHRTQPMSLFVLARSSIHLNGTSNRLNASSPRARFLGMIVATAISDLVDKPGSKMNFDVDELKMPEGIWYQSLVRIDDKIGRYSDVKQIFSACEKLTPIKPKANKGVTPTKKPTSPKPKPPAVTEVQGPRIVEVLDESEEDDDLVPYAKPDSDPEDEDEDPTLINRDKPKAPVYIRDLILGLNDSENYDRHFLALKHAASLIRRKASFGKEVSDHAIELASILVGLGDPFEMENFVELRLQALIAVLISKPAQMAPWFARQVFDGDYSLSQRATVLSVLGLGARELAGYKGEDEELNPAIPSTAFPSKQLPERLHKLYAAGRNAPVARIASNLERSMIEPMALGAADKMSGPNVLKVRTFSSRMEVEKKRKRVIPNTLAKIVAEGFFFPLTGRWWQNLQAYGAENVHFQPFLLSTYLKTLALILHAAGSGTVSLPQMTAEFWELLLNIRTNALADVSVLEAVLFATLTLLDMNEDKRRLAEEHSKQLIETQEWVELVFDRVGGGDEEGERIRMLAASVLMKTREVVDKYQRLLAVELVDY